MMERATSCASASSVSCSSTSTNSSPPSLASVSMSRNRRDIRCATRRSRSSPAVVTQAVVNALESVEVEVEHGAPSAVAARTFDRVPQPQRKQ